MSSITTVSPQGPVDEALDAAPASQPLSVDDMVHGGYPNHNLGPKPLLGFKGHGTPSGQIHPSRNSESRAFADLNGGLGITHLASATQELLAQSMQPLQRLLHHHPGRAWGHTAPHQLSSSATAPSQPPHITPAAGSGKDGRDSGSDRGGVTTPTRMGKSQGPGSDQQPGRLSYNSSPAPRFDLHQYLFSKDGGAEKPVVGGLTGTEVLPLHLSLSWQAKTYPHRMPPTTSAALAHQTALACNALATLVRFGPQQQETTKAGSRSSVQAGMASHAPNTLADSGSGFDARIGQSHGRGGGATARHPVDATSSGMPPKFLDVFTEAGAVDSADRFGVRSVGGIGKEAPPPFPDHQIGRQRGSRKQVDLREAAAGAATTTADLPATPPVHHWWNHLLHLRPSAKTSVAAYDYGARGSSGGSDIGGDDDGEDDGVDEDPLEESGVLSVEDLESCRALVFMHTVKVGLGVSFRHGAGFLVRRIPPSSVPRVPASSSASRPPSWTRRPGGDVWSAPCFLSVDGVSLGLTLGVNAAHTIVVVKTDEALERVLSHGHLLEIHRDVETVFGSRTGVHNEGEQGSLAHAAGMFAPPSPFQSPSSREGLTSSSSKSGGSSGAPGAGAEAHAADVSSGLPLPHLPALRSYTVQDGVLVDVSMEGGYLRVDEKKMMEVYGEMYGEWLNVVHPPTTEEPPTPPPTVVGTQFGSQIVAAVLSGALPPPPEMAPLYASLDMLLLGYRRGAASATRGAQGRGRSVKGATETSKRGEEHLGWSKDASATAAALASKL